MHYEQLYCNLNLKFKFNIENNNLLQPPDYRHKITLYKTPTALEFC